jgi:hypothetical protein
MTDLMCKNTHSCQHKRVPNKTVFFEENAKGSPQKWGDNDDEDMNGAPQKNNEGSNDPGTAEDEGAKGLNDNPEKSAIASSSAQNLGSPSGKDEQDPTSAESQLHRGELAGYTVKGDLGKFKSSGGNQSLWRNPSRQR